MRWRPIGGGLFCPVAVSDGRGRVLLIARGVGGELLTRQLEAGSWGQLRSLGLPVARSKAGSEPPVPADWQLTACSDGATRIDVFGRSPDGDLLHLSGDGETWDAFECLGAPATSEAGVAIPLGFAGPPAACSAGAGRIDVFAAGATGELLQTWREDTEWSGFASLGIPTLLSGGRQRPVPLSGPLAACRCGPDPIALFFRGADGDLLVKWWDGKRWSELESLGWPELQEELYPAVAFAAPLTGPPAACSARPDRIDVFARGARGDVVHKWWNGSTWSEFASLGMPVSANDELLPSTGALAACASVAGRIDVFTRAVDGRLYHCWWDGTWQPA
jgi:hypothetical protein